MSLKDISKILFFAYALNNFTLPISYSFRNIPKGLENPRIQEVMQTDSYGENFEGSDALDFLRLAHAITSKNIRYCSEQWPTDEENLENGVGDCYQISRYTYSNYLSLIDQNNRGDLSSEVRLGFGEVFSEKDGGGHCCLEVKDQNGQWIEYETTAIDLPRGIEIIPSSIDSLVLDSEVLDLGRLSYNGVIYFQRDDEDISTKLDFLNMLKSRGLSYHIYSSIKHQL